MHGIHGLSKAKVDGRCNYWRAGCFGGELNLESFLAASAVIYDDEPSTIACEYIHAVSDRTLRPRDLMNPRCRSIDAPH